MEGRYALSIQFKDFTVGRVPKFLSKLTYFFLKNELTLHVKATEERKYSYDLEYNGMEQSVHFYDIKQYAVTTDVAEKYKAL